ncbi:MAG: hypothetical protein A2538_00320 [Candidatus Magasanikbacteria bacterium RIFOXYD2_FULL_41_14]|uniref:Uncharacterized protein n=1 Tax=Candidatus Magasanikbacteria bacterium RIFOXYD2_FULL_41_14 TaxID=1798709 RepID=A0A1F6PEL6_9BACT|nr:MAG: hypothetical protein A2538_00320 [Candidatus Magasanikbacteria bacterium RIFOXYD2_FULL_41_14]
MSGEELSHGVYSLSQLESLCDREKGRLLEAVVCENLGQDIALYKALMDEMIVREQREKNLDFNQAKDVVVRRVLLSLDRVASDPVLSADLTKMEKAHAGMIIWLDLLKQMRSDRNV